MLLSEPKESPYDVRFSLGQFPVRVSWTFWLAGLIFGYDAAQQIDWLFVESSSGLLPWLLVWVGVVFISILVHELGHALAFRACGVESSVVLYHFGGMAMPQRSRRLGPWEQIFISAAGPVAQLILALLLIVVYRVSGFALAGGSVEMIEQQQGVVSLVPSVLRWIPTLETGKPITDPGMFALLEFGLFVNIWWPLLNLIPVWPLDGGQIAREVVLLAGGSIDLSLKISFLVAAAVGGYFILGGQFFAGVLFISLAASSYQLLSMVGRWRM